MVIIDHGLQTLTHEVIVPHSGWEREPNEDSKPRDAEWTTVFKNTSGCLRWGWGRAQAPPEQPPWAVPGQGGRSRAPEPACKQLSWESHVLLSQITWETASCPSLRDQPCHNSRPSPESGASWAYTCSQGPPLDRVCHPAQLRLTLPSS